MQLGLKPIALYTHILTTILNMVYLKILSIAIIQTARLKMILSVIKNVILIYKTHNKTPLTPCTHAYNHITQHINNLDDQTQQNTLYTMEEDASLFTSNTAAPCDYNITKGVKNSDTISEDKSKLYHQWEFICKVNTSTEMSLVIPTCNTMTSIIVMHSLSKINTHHYYNRNYKTCIGVSTTL